MNKLKTTDLGGFPLTLDDLRWIDDGVRDALKAVFAAYGDKFIISGCELTYDPIEVEYTCTAGYIYFNGEILYCEGGTATHDGESTFAGWNLEVSYDPEGNKTFANSEQHDTYEIRVALFQSFTSQQLPGKLLATSAERLEELIAQSITSLDEAWIEPTLLNGWETGQPPVEQIAYTKDALGKVMLRGSATNPSATPDPEVFVLPAGYRPQQDMYFAGIDAETFEFLPVKISTNGTVYAPLENQQNIGLDGIIFRVD